ncbi:hypothetical protein FBU59_003532 [Linderina macrospora]|uniref:Uncharacterized protein n=1 Tax=Linderina macrospora TaxID=4868 RepID=A0ACC1J893_9FUNG|nr:hypothetical protein FBU59_003532 [Linderina macrospora]
MLVPLPTRTAIVQESERDAARIARMLPQTTSDGTLSTTLPCGTAFGIPEYVCESPLTPGNVIFCLTDLSRAARNLNDNNGASVMIKADAASGSLVTNPRVTLVGKVGEVSQEDKEAVKKVYVEVHPDSRHYVQWADFRFYELSVESVYFVGGFGGQHYIGPVGLELYRSAQP